MTDKEYYHLCWSEYEQKRSHIRQKCDQEEEQNITCISLQN